MFIDLINKQIFENIIECLLLKKSLYDKVL